MSTTKAHRVKVTSRAHKRIEEKAAQKRREQLAAYLATGRRWTQTRRNGLRFIDIFCGAGGSSVGLAMAGYELLLGANHWQTAIDTHSANFTDAEHLCADINSYDMRYLPRGADVLWASPICTELSPSGGRSRVKRSADGSPNMVEELGHVSQKGMQRTRATFFDVLRAAEVWRFKAVIVENVPEAVDWELFDIWLAGFERLNYAWKIVSVNTAHVGGGNIPFGAQWRDRIYVALVRKDIGAMPDLEPRPLSRCFACERDVHGVQTWAPATKARRRFLVGKYRRRPDSSYGQYWYTCPVCRERVEPYVLPAATIIDWSDLGVRIGDLPRTPQKPEGLAPNTMRRIRAGLAKYGRPVYATAAGNTFEREGYMRVWPLDGQPLGTAQCTNTQAIAIPPGAFVLKNHDGYVEPHRTVKGVGEEPLGTVTTGNAHSLVTPRPFLVNFNHDDDRIVPVDQQPVATCTTKIGSGLVVPPMMVPLGGTWADEPISVLDEPARTVMANEKGCEGLVTPEPFLAILRNNGDAVSLREPIPTVTAAGTHHALIVPYYTNGVATDTDEPLGTVSTLDRYAMVGADQLRHGAEISAEDALYRMLKPRENLRAQTFPDEYIVLGGAGEQTMQAGNAVSCNVAQWIGERLAQVLLPLGG